MSLTRGQMSLNQGFGSGSGLDPKSIRSVDQNPDSNLGGKKWPTVYKFHLWSAGCFLFLTEGFSRSLDVLYGGLEIRKLQFFSKIYHIFFKCKFCFHLWSSKLDPDRYSAEDAGSGSGINESGSWTPLFKHIFSLRAHLGEGRWNHAGCFALFDGKKFAAAVRLPQFRLGKGTHENLIKNQMWKTDDYQKMTEINN
jgi:hypothetical protein